VSGKTAEQQARDLLEQYGLEGAQSMTAGDVVELANLISDANAYRSWNWRTYANAYRNYDPQAVDRVVHILRENADVNHPLSIYLLKILGAEPYASWTTEDGQ
jgi:hypothetical protein